MQWGDYLTPQGVRLVQKYTFRLWIALGCAALVGGVVGWTLRRAGTPENTQRKDPKG